MSKNNFDCEIHQISLKVMHMLTFILRLQWKCSLCLCCTYILVTFPMIFECFRRPKTPFSCYSGTQRCHSCFSYETVREPNTSSSAIFGEPLPVNSRVMLWCLFVAEKTRYNANTPQSIFYSLAWLFTAKITLLSLAVSQHCYVSL